MNLAPQIALMRQLLDDYEAGMKPDGIPTDARDAAYQMTQLLSTLYADAYRAAVEQQRRQGRTG